MATTIKLGKNTTVSNVTGVVDASMKVEVEKIDATTRGASGVYKRMVAGLASRTLEVTAIGDYTHTYGESKSVVVSVSGSAAFSMTGVVTKVTRSEPIGDKITNTLTIKPGDPLDNGDQIDI